MENKRRNKEQGTRNKEQGTRNKEQETRNKKDEERALNFKKNRGLGALDFSALEGKRIRLSCFLLQWSEEVRCSQPCRGS